MNMNIINMFRDQVIKDGFAISPFNSDYSEERDREIIDLVFLGKKYDYSISEYDNVGIICVKYNFSEDSIEKLKQLREQYGDLL